MSININVHGNPSSFTYKRDKFCDFETAKNEEIKRRKLFRLEQVCFHKYFPQFYQNFTQIPFYNFRFDNNQK